ncbi:MAG TPA: hypothetical protein VHC50_11575, partial [Puia sp.]|nr:hypothetical protein [Puia sp.]
MKKDIANWGNYPVMESDEQNFTMLDDMTRYVRNAETFIPRGNGRCYGDASLADNTVCTVKYDKILSFDVA